MSLTATSIKFPPKLKKEAQKMVKKGYFKSFSDLVTHATRLVVSGYYPQHAADVVHELRRKTWDKYLVKAKGDEELASKLYFRDLKKLEEESTIFKTIPKAER